VKPAKNDCTDGGMVLAPRLLCLAKPLGLLRKKQRGKQNGGGIYCSQASPTIRNCTIEGNNAPEGGGMYNYLCSPIVTNCFFSSNYASVGYGGGMFNFASSALITNCVFSGNKAGRGGGMYNNSSSPKVTNCTFSGNVADYVGGMYNHAVFPSFTVTNCIFWGNTPPEQIFGSAIVTYSDVQGGWSGTGNIDSDPCFVDINDPCGPDGIFGTFDDGLRLTIDSNCIDAADGNAAPATDILGFGRFDVGSVDNNGVGDPNYADIGAYEFGVVGHSVVHFSGIFVADEYEWGFFSEAFVEDYASDILGPGDYPDTEVAIPDVIGDNTFDSIAIPWGRRVIIYSGENFTGDILLNKAGPAVIYNVGRIDNDYVNYVVDEVWPEPLQSEFPPCVREWSETEMNDLFGEPGWEHGSFKIKIE